MNTCVCGSFVDDKSTLCPRCAALQVLGLTTNATEPEIRRAYRVLVKAWHPDRFQDDQKLKDAAETKLKDINSAFEFLTSTTWERGQGQPSAPHFTSATSEQPSPEREPAAAQSPTGAAPAVMPRWSARLLLWPAARILFRVAMIGFVILLGRYTWIAFDLPGSPAEEVTMVYGASKDTLLKGLETPRRRFVQAVEGDLRRLGVLRSTPAPADNPLMGEAARPSSQQAGKAAPERMNNRPPEPTPAAPRKLLPYITVGSTMEEVLAQQGPPTASSENKLVYGKSELYFKDGSVIGWRIDPAASPIRVKLWPASAVDPGLASYTVGSSKDVVLTVQGTPTAFTPDKFEYGKSEVYFRNNKVVGWKEEPASAPLWAR
jgi:hypothetical protein